MAVFTKLRTSLFTTPRASSVAPMRLSTKEPIVAAENHHRQRPRGNQTRRHAKRAECKRAKKSGGGPFRRNRSRRSRRNPRECRQQHGPSSPGLADFARHGVAATGREGGDEGKTRSITGIRERAEQRGDRRDPGIRERVASPASSAFALGDSQPRLPLESQPSR